MILIQAKHCQKTVETSQPPLNVLPVFIVTEQTVLVQSVYVKHVSWESLYLSAPLVLVLLDFDNNINQSTTKMDQ